MGWLRPGELPVPGAGPSGAEAPAHGRRNQTGTESQESCNHKKLGKWCHPLSSELAELVAFELIIF